MLASGAGPWEKSPVIVDTTGSRRLRLNLFRFDIVVPHGDSYRCWSQGAVLSTTKRESHCLVKGPSLRKSEHVGRGTVNGRG